MKPAISSSLVLTACLMASAGPALADTVIRIGHATPESSPIHQSLLHFQESVEEASEGDIEVKLYPGGQIGSVNEMTELVQSGNLQMTMGASVLLTSAVPELSVLDHFYLFDDVAHARRVLDGEGGDMLSKAMADKGLQSIGFFERGFRHFSTSTEPLDSFESFQGLRMRSASNPAQIEAWRAVGAAPMPLDWGEIYTSLQQGLIDGQESALSSIYIERFFEAQDYVSLTGHIYTTEIWYANRSFWEELDDESRAIINAAAEETVALQRELTQQQNRDTVALLEEEGLEFNEVDAEVKSALGEALNGAVDEAIIERVGNEFYTEFMSHI
ncbi:TRAP transporter substrate-binding protein [Halomonas borealis]|uniref:TRAP transporter substrate-binding protein n=1 Tax=Halomonas borealis TaxID=2508710 RepID=UPI0010A0B88A|nr:TRAP transporter substrate-binding protein [Halomonas borealis]